MTVKRRLTDPGWFIHELEVRPVVLILGCMTSNFLYLGFSTLYSSSLWRTDLIVFAKFSVSGKWCSKINTARLHV